MADATIIRPEPTIRLTLTLQEAERLRYLTRDWLRYVGDGETRAIHTALTGVLAAM